MESFGTDVAINELHAPRSPRSISCTALRFIGGAAYSRAKDGAGQGEDSYFLEAPSGSLGVADGLGGTREILRGQTAKAFADELMAGCKAAALEASVGPDSAPRRNVEVVAGEIIRKAYASTSSYGASTVAVAQLDSSSKRLGVAVLGDSEVFVVRWPDPDKTGMIVFKSPRQQHSFNAPRYLAHLPSDCLQNLSRPLDSPSDCSTFDVAVQSGDLVLAVSDGVTDNLHDEEIIKFCDSARADFSADATVSADSLVHTLGTAAYERSLEPMVLTPFKLESMRAGKPWSGGKEDDITCVAALIR
jgi:protein phosphatase PTC7